MRNTVLLRRAAASLIATAAGVAIATAATGSASAAPSPGVCSGGSILGGTYAALTVTGSCRVDHGTVNVTGNVKVVAGGQLLAAFGGSDLQVKGTVSSGFGSVLILGCGPTSYPCLDDPHPATPTRVAHAYIDGAVKTEESRAVALGGASVKGAASMLDGVHDRGCGDTTLFKIVNTNFGAGVKISDNSVCAMTFAGNRVAGPVTLTDNVANDGNDFVVDGNTITGDLRCSGNSTAPTGGAAQTPNLVGGQRTGQCQSTSLP